MTKIMFNDKYGLTEAVLNGKKTQTRRAVEFAGKTYEKALRDRFSIRDTKFKDCLLKYSAYKVGEVVAVAQAYKDIPSIANSNFVDVDWDRVSKHNPFGKWGCASKLPGWKNKMFVRADQMPHHIRITNIRVEKLRDISDEDCLAEGIHEALKAPNDNKVYGFVGGNNFNFNTPREAYAALIDKVSGKGTWDSNPYVFVYEFVKED